MEKEARTQQDVQNDFNILCGRIGEKVYLIEKHAAEITELKKLFPELEKELQAFKEVANEQPTSP